MDVPSMSLRDGLLLTGTPIAMATAGIAGTVVTMQQLPTDVVGVNTPTLAVITAMFGSLVAALVGVHRLLMTAKDTGQQAVMASKDEAQRSVLAAKDESIGLLKERAAMLSQHIDVLTSQQEKTDVRMVELLTTTIKASETANTQLVHSVQELVQHNQRTADLNSREHLEIMRAVGKAPLGDGQRKAASAS